jgi:D-glycero-alpha-D-manno-heptose-7-phosphate kinase
MIISRTPYRISFLGGGTDYPAWYLKHGGAVLATTIDKYCYLSCRYLPPFFEHRIRVVYSAIETCSRVEEIRHPAVRAILQYLRVNRGLEIHHDGDLPARSGVGSSSSFTVGLLHALHALDGRMPAKSDLARQAIEIEQEHIRETVGSQDQVLAAHGGFNHITFDQNGHITCRPVTIAPPKLKELDAHLMLFYTGIKRTASNVAGTYVGDEKMDAKKRQLRILKDLVDEGIEILSGDRDLNLFGELLHEAWLAKRSLSDTVSNPKVDAIYESARNAGAIGGKLTGAGGGGFVLLFVPPERRQQVLARLDKLIHVPFQFERQGAQIIFYDVETDYSAVEHSRMKTNPHYLFEELQPDDQSVGIQPR